MDSKTFLHALECFMAYGKNDGLINLDFCDIKTLVSGCKLDGFYAEAKKEGADNCPARRAVEAIIKQNPKAFKTAQNVIMNIMGGLDMTLFDVTEAANALQKAVNDNTDIIFGALNSGKEGIVTISIIIANGK